MPQQYADVQTIRGSRPLRVLMLSWEYPPVVVGGLGRHVHALSVALANEGHEVTVVTRHAPGAALEEWAEGVRIVRAPEDPVPFPLATNTLLAWTMAFNHTLTRAALHAAATGGYDVIHAHDWLVTHAAVTLKEHLDLPLVATIHATEAGRHQGWLPEEMNRTIHNVETWLSHEACRVLVCSGYMKWEITRLFHVAQSRVEVIANGVYSDVWQAAPRAVAAARAKFAGDGPLIGYAGRLVYEKGVQDLLAALPALVERHEGLKLVIAGDGPHKEELQRDVDRLGLHDVVEFAGFMNEAQLPAVLAATDAMIVPSIYEPFGMVALEAAAAGAPIAVAATGGLAEIVEPGVTGVTFAPKDPQSLADAVSGLLSDDMLRRRVAKQGQAMVAERYAWSAIAGATADAYRTSVREQPGFEARAALAQMSGGKPRLTVPEGNLLAPVGAAS